MIIEDEELRSLFKTETNEHLQHLDEGLLRLESDPTDTAILESLFRDAHSLKGAAGMLGVTVVETVAHRFEDLLSSARNGEISLTSATVDRMYRALDAISRLAAACCHISSLEIFFCQSATSQLAPVKNRTVTAA